MVSEEQIIKWYQEAKDKEKAIKQIAKKVGISQEGVITVLNRYDLEAPKSFEIIEEWDKGYESEEDTLIEEELFTSVAIQKYWEARWSNLDDIEKAMRRHEYIKQKFKLNDFGVYCFVQDYLIKNHGVNGLLTDIERVMKGADQKRGKQQKAEEILEDIKTRWLTR